MRRFVCFVSVIMILAMLYAPVAAEGNGAAYGQLSSDAYREAYRLLEEGIAGMAPVIHFPKELEIRYVDMLQIARSVCLDHPEYFWFLESWFYEYDTGDGRYLVEQMTPTYFLDHQKVSAGSQLLADAMIDFHDKVNEIIAGIPVNYTDDYQIALYLHDYLTEHITYTLDGDHDSAYAALVHGKAACYGYSKAYQYLLSRVGIRSQIIVGDSRDENGELVGHAWNQVWIDGACYYTDVTWDDMDPGTVHQYFLADLETFSVNHIPEEMFVLPECGHSLDYYQRSAGKGTAYISADVTGKKAAEYFTLVEQTENQATFICEMRMEGDIEVWLDRNISTVVSMLSLSYRTEILYYVIEDVYYVIITDYAYRPTYAKSRSLTLNLSQVTLNGAGAQAQLSAEISPFSASILPPSYETDDPSVVTVSADGMITAIGPGSATVTVTSADGLQSAQCVVTVEEQPPHIHTMRLIGASAPTCELDGNDAYYLCTGCFRRFGDEAGTQIYTDVGSYARAATGHVDLTWVPRKNTNSHNQECVCGRTIVGTVAPHKDEDGDGFCDICHAEIKTVQPQNPVTEDEGKIDIVTVVWIGGGLLALGVVIFQVFRRRY